jgi:hypothetical protein
VTDEQLLAEVKLRIGVTGSYQDDKIQGYIDDVKLFMSDAGVAGTVMESKQIVGAVARGVSDLLYGYGGGDGDFSEFFYRRVTQLTYQKDGGSNE